MGVACGERGAFCIPTGAAFCAGEWADAGGAAVYACAFPVAIDDGGGGGCEGEEVGDGAWGDLVVVFGFLSVGELGGVAEFADVAV